MHRSHVFDGNAYYKTAGYIARKTTREMPIPCKTNRFGPRLQVTPTPCSISNPVSAALLTPLAVLSAMGSGPAAFVVVLETVSRVLPQAFSGSR
jgi:hypothetical protein